MKQQQAKPQPKYKFYATLLDAFQGYLSFAEIWQQYWGNSDNPFKSLEEFEKEQFEGLINKINRVPFDSEAADRGTVFNEVVDMIILGQATNDKVSVSTDRERGIITAVLTERPDRVFEFPISICAEFARYYNGATPQVFTQGLLSTSYGDVLLYGYIDELMPTSVHDIKTTGKYSVGKYRNNWQHLVYPYCLELQGSIITEFEYNIAQIDKYGKIDTFTEQYTYRAERDIPLLQSHCEMLIDFLEYNRHLITDKKIFGEEQWISR